MCCSQSIQTQSDKDGVGDAVKTLTLSGEKMTTYVGLVDYVCARVWTGLDAIQMPEISGIAK